MANIASLFQVPEAPQPSVTRRRKDIQESSAQLLELRTENGAVYLRPNRWQRIRLQWTFRHFHVLSPQVLSRADQRLIEKLSQSAVVTPVQPVAGQAVLGVVEKVRSKAPASANRVVTLRPAAPATPAWRATAAARDVPNPVLSVLWKPRWTKVPRAIAVRKVSELPFEQWRELGALAAVGFLVILASVYRDALYPAVDPRALSASIAHAAALRPAAITPLLISPAALIPKLEKPKRWTPGSVAEGAGPSVSAGTSPAAPLATVSDTISAPASIAPSAAPERLFIAELPPGHFAHPVDAQGKLLGELQLKALIGADGLVKEVTVLSGSPALAKAGMRAVRQWHYSPYQVQGSPVEVETHIKMNFFGQDAVSIAAVPGGAASQQ